ncbi:MAG: hypothetical protein ACRDIE_19225 [Chloroflexota bacterium]
MHWSKRALMAALVVLGTGAFTAPTITTHAAAKPMHHYVIQADFVLGAKGLPPKADACIANAVFHPGQQIVWRARIYDSATGKVVAPGQVKKLGLTATVVLKSGKKFAMMNIPHPPQAKKQVFYWTAAWVVSKTYPFGPLVWTINAKDSSGGSTTFAPIGQDVGVPSIIIAPAK